MTWSQQMKEIQIKEANKGINYFILNKKCDWFLCFDVFFLFPMHHGQNGDNTASAANDLKINVDITFY